MEEDGLFDVLPKKKLLNLKRIRPFNQILRRYSWYEIYASSIIRSWPRKERNAIAEARKLNIPIVGIVDTNCDPDEIDYVIPANDDAIRAVKLLTGKMADAVLEGQQGVSNDEVAAEQNINLDEKEESQEAESTEENTTVESN